VTNFLIANLKFVSYVGDTVYIPAAIAGIMIYYLTVHGLMKEAFSIVIAALSNPVSFILKFLYKSPRPPTAHYKFQFDKYGLPSGHVMTYTVVFGYLLFLCFKMKVLPFPLRLMVGAASVYFIALVGVSRVYLGQHYVIDVISGYIFGIIYLLILITIQSKL
jgi:undecaprenyl-diphosphatase